jgi:hypothetical protein
MISKLAGVLLKKNMKTKIWWVKLGLCLVFSNLFFFVLFGGSTSKETTLSSTPKGSVDVQLTATHSTPFEAGKKVLLVHRKSRKRVEGELKALNDTHTTLTVSEENAVILLSHENWEILPYLKDFRFNEIARGESYEIHY